MAEEKAKKTKLSDRTKAENIEGEIIDLAKKQTSPAKIGLILKEKYGVEKFRALGKRITAVLKENKINYESDLTFVNKRIKRIKEHYNKNKQDKRAEREIIRLIGLKNRLERYYA